MAPLNPAGKGCLFIQIKQNPICWYYTPFFFNLKTIVLCSLITQRLRSSFCRNISIIEQSSFSVASITKNKVKLKCRMNIRTQLRTLSQISQNKPFKTNNLWKCPIQFRHTQNLETLCLFLKKR